jgi:hypothetical protein
MINATIYDIGTGAILYPVSLLNETEAEENCAEGQSYILGTYDGNTTRIVDGQPTPIPQEEIEQAEIARAWENLRTIRDVKLSRCDWTQVPDAPVDHAAWAVYRQQLRDLPDNTEDPRNPVWPTPPA